METKGIFLSWIVVKDIDKAIKFYTDVVGLSLREYDKQFKWAELSGPDGTILGITQENKDYKMHAGTNAVVTVTVKDIKKAREKFMTKGVNLIGDIMEVPGHVKLQTFADSDGNQFQLAELLTPQ